MFFLHTVSGSMCVSKIVVPSSTYGHTLWSYLSYIVNLSKSRSVCYDCMKTKRFIIALMGGFLVYKSARRLILRISSISSKNLMINYNSAAPLQMSFFMIILICSVI